MPHYQQSDAIRLVFTKGQPLSFGKGEIIVGNGAEPDGLYYIDTGYVKVYSINDDGSQSIRIIFGSGEIFPMVWAYLGIHEGALYYETMSSCLLWRVSRQRFLDMINDDLAISNAMTFQLAQQTSMFANRLENLEYREGHERVAYRLLYLASRFGARENGTIRIEAPVTHEIIARTINLARESVSRELERLEREKFITQDKHVICILNAKGLAAKLSRPIDFSEWYLS